MEALEALALQGISVEVRTVLYSTGPLDLAETIGGETSPVTKFLRPRLIVRRKGSPQPILDRAPYGDPAKAPPWGWIALGAVALLLWWRLGR